MLGETNEPESMGSIRLSLEQELALEASVDRDNKLTAITGGAGTGKTTLIKRMYEELRKTGKVAVAAPTGRAAKRIKEATGIDALTIHRLLEFPLPDEDGTPGVPKRNAYNRLDYSAIIIDETSMVDQLLYSQLMEAIPRSSVVRFVGDANQLPPVGEGRPFKTLLSREDLPTFWLTHNYRSGDAILENAERVLAGRQPIQNAATTIVRDSTPHKYLIGLLDDAFCGFDAQAITPTRRGNYGTEHLNVSLQIKFNPTGPHLELPRQEDKKADLVVRPGDKIIWTKNDYVLGLFNGDMGVIEDVDQEDGSLKLLIDGEREVEVPPTAQYFHRAYNTTITYDPRKAIDLGYVVTTHKAQGAEFDQVVYCISSKAAFLLDRSNLYTALTRAKRSLTIITDAKALFLSTRMPK